MVWRSEGDSYHLISDIILSPHNKTSGGPRFQYVHGEVIRVKQGDIIGIYSTRKNIISMSGDNPNQKAVKRLNGTGIYQGHPSLPKSEFHNVGKRDVSLRAFIAGRYISL